MKNRHALYFTPSLKLSAPSGTIYWANQHDDLVLECENKEVLIDFLDTIQRFLPVKGGFVRRYKTLQLLKAQLVQDIIIRISGKEIYRLSPNAWMLSTVWDTYQLLKKQ